MQVEIVPFEPRHAAAFRALNEAWISQHFTVEPKDRVILEDPEGQILGKGGRIFIAERDDGIVVGCVALLRMADGGYEVAKMTVDASARGTGVGRALMERCIEAGIAAGAPRLYLESNALLAPALGLYRSVGFRDLPAAESEYTRADVFMERPLP